MSNESLLNIQMRKLAEHAVTEASSRFGQVLDFTEESIEKLEMLLQQAYSRQKELAYKNKLSNDAILHTSRIWGAYLGELIRYKRGGNWMANKDDVFLVIDGQETFPIKQVQQRITGGAQYSIESYYHTIARNSNNTYKPLTDSRHKSPGGKQSANLLQPDGNIECPSCRSSMPSWYLVCTNCGYDLVDRSKVKPPERASRNLSTKVSGAATTQCPNCHGYKVSTGISGGMIILHIILIFITTGVWLFVILVWALLSPKRKGTYKCRTCGYEWG